MKIVIKDIVDALINNYPDIEIKTIFIYSGKGFEYECGEGVIQEKTIGMTDIVGTVSLNYSVFHYKYNDIDIRVIKTSSLPDDMSRIIFNEDRLEQYKYFSYDSNG